jgi:hypothetical protein
MTSFVEAYNNDKNTQMTEHKTVKTKLIALLVRHVAILTDAMTKTSLIQ